MASEHLSEVQLELYTAQDTSSAVNGIDDVMNQSNQDASSLCTSMF